MPKVSKVRESKIFNKKSDHFTCVTEFCVKPDRNAWKKMCTHGVKK